MTIEIVPASQALKRAKDALQRGDKQAARRWAQVTVSMVPNMEDPWLIMAAVANPRASVIYLERALEIAPDSERARKGLEWARGRPAWEQSQPIRRKVD
jgi:Tfp pilus assembly protein PilF